VHWPDVSALEPGVQQHLLNSQAFLATAVANPAATDLTLSEAYGVMGQTYHAYSLYLPARECYLNAGRLAPADFRWIYLTAKIDQQEGRVDEAIKGYVQVRELNPQYVAAAVSLGNTFLESNRLGEARLSYEAALKIDKDNAAAHYGLGQVALSERSYRDAARYFERALAIVPAATRIHYSLAMAYRGLGERQRAKDNLDLQGNVGVRSADPLIDGLQELIKGERVHLIRGRLALEAHRYPEAAAEFRKAIAENPNTVVGRVNLGGTLSLLGDLPGAKRQFEEVVRIAPDNLNARYNLGLLLANENRHEEAIVHLQTMLKYSPIDAGARFLLAREYLKLNRRDEALSEFSRVVQTDPDNEDALLEQVQLLLEKKQYKDALDGLEKSHAQFPEKGQTAAALARLLAVSPMYEQRNGARALELARLIYKATGLLEDGELVSMALAESGL
jgi:tetratricopeptide (TPR) repeat protein